MYFDNSGQLVRLMRRDSMPIIRFSHQPYQLTTVIEIQQLALVITKTLDEYSFDHFEYPAGCCSSFGHHQIKIGAWYRHAYQVVVSRPNGEQWQSIRHSHWQDHGIESLTRTSCTWDITWRMPRIWLSRHLVWFKHSLILVASTIFIKLRLLIDWQNNERYEQPSQVLDLKQVWHVTRMKWSTEVRFGIFVPHWLHLAAYLNHDAKACCYDSCPCSTPSPKRIHRHTFLVHRSLFYKPFLGHLSRHVVVEMESLKRRGLLL